MGVLWDILRVTALAVAALVGAFLASVFYDEWKALRREREKQAEWVRDFEARNAGVTAFVLSEDEYQRIQQAGGPEALVRDPCPPGLEDIRARLDAWLADDKSK